jgi:6-phosphogluconolactonase
VAPGSGPRHFAFLPGGGYAFVLNEILSTVTAFAYDRRLGHLSSQQTTSTLPKDTAGGNSTAEIVVHPSGKFLYASNRGHDSIAIFSIQAGTGQLALLGNESTRGKTPRNFAIDPTGAYLLAANQSTNTIATFRIDQLTGMLQPIGVPVTVPTPVCIEFVPN